MNENSNLSSFTAFTNRLKALRSVYTKNKTLWGILITLSFALGFAFLGFWLNSIFVFPVEARVGYIGLAFLVLVISISYFCLRPILYKPNLETVALKLEEKFPELNNRLIAALQLAENLEENPEGYSTEMIEAVIEQADLTTQKLDLQKIIDKNPIKRIGKVAGSLAFVSLFFALVFPTAFQNSLYIFSHPLTEFASPQKFLFVVSPGNAEVVKYSDVKIKINLEGEKPKRVNLYWRNEGAKWNEEKLAIAKDKGTSLESPDFSFDFKEVKRNFDYYAEAEGVKSEQYRINVVDKPRVIGLRLTFNYPRYTQLKTQVVDENDGNINAIVGTKVQIEAKSNKELSDANIVFSDSTKSQMQIKGAVATGEILVKKDDFYHIEVWDSLGNKNQDPIEYKITKTDDQYPVVEILEPGHDQDLSENMRVPLLIRISDDCGFSALLLYYQIVSGGQEKDQKEIKIDIPNNNGVELDVEYLWNLSSLPLVPGDLVKYKAVIYDNDTFLGPKKSESKTYSVRLPSLDEIVGEVEREQGGQVEDLETLLKGQRELKKKIEDLSRELDRPTGLDMDWQKRQQMEDILEKQQKLAQDLKNMAQRMDENIGKIEENKLAALETLEKLAEIRDLMEQIMTPEMKEALRKLAEALKNLDPELLKQALEKMKISQEELLKRLDRTIALLKKMQAEQKLENLIKMAERMAQTQDQINQSTQNSEKEKLPELSDKEKELKQDLNNFEEKLKEFADLSKEISLLPPEEIDQLQRMPEESGVKQDMDQMISQLSGMNPSGALNSGGSCSKKLKEMTDRLKSTQEKMQMKMKKEVADAIKKSLYDVFGLSDNQESLFTQVEGLERIDMELRSLARNQQNLKAGATRVAEDLDTLAKKTIFVDADLRRFMALSVASMDKATKNLEDRKGEMASDEQKEAVYDLNVTARKLMQALSEAQKSCSGSGTEQMFKQLQSMCNKQSGINQETEQMGMCNKPGGGSPSLSLSEQAAMQRLAAEQDAVRKSLGELEKEFGNRSEILGKMSDLGEEMKKVTGDMERLQVDQSTVDRQKKILSRLLDAEKSMRERDFSKQRRAEVGEDVSRPSPKELPSDLYQADQMAKDDLSKFMEEAYPKEYEQLIKDYFKALSEEGMKK
jgi:hypothetical protein